MTKKVITIVGGGIVGIYAALYISKTQNYRVILIENQKKLGGLLNSINHEGNIFDYGTHIINNTLNSEIDELIYENLGDNWNYFSSFSPGNILNNLLYEKSGYPYLPSVLNNYEKALIQLLKSKHNTLNQDKNLKRALDESFGEIITESVYRKIFKKLLGAELEDLTTNAFLTFDLKRVIVGQDFLSQELKKSKIYDTKIAYPDYRIGSSQNVRMYPKSGGIETWIKELTEKLKVNQVEIYTETKVQKIIKQENIFVKTDKENFESDLLFWTAPRNKYFEMVDSNLNLEQNKVQQTSAFRNTLLLHYIFDTPFLVQNQYIYCWDDSSPFFRITFYPHITLNYNDIKCTVELFFDSEQDLKKITFDKIKDELIRLGIIDKRTKTIKQYQDILYNSFPIMDLLNIQKEVEIDSRVEFLGKAKGNTFFINNNLIEAHNILKCKLKGES